ncbi:hypothetical protein ABH930_000208 [Kitasatospora sp. GAS204A]|nr:hypothetical protein [Kitasatospora sp. GAS204B]
MTGMGVEQDRLRDYLTGPRLDHALFAPGFVAEVGAAKLTGIRDRIRKDFGGLGSIRPDEAAGTYRVDCPRGVLRAEIAVDEQGLISRLWLEPQLDDRPRSVGQRVKALLQLAVLMLATLGVPLIAVGSALVDSRILMLPGLLISLAMLVVLWLSAPWCWASQYLRAVFAAVVLGALVLAMTRLPGLPTGHLLWTYLGGPVFAGWAAVSTLSGRREAPAERTPLLIANPLPGSRVLVGQGGGKSVNHHAAHPTQRYALDLLCLGRLGARARGLAPRRLTAYRAYGAVVAAPCEATVVLAVDGHADQPVLANPFEPGALQPQPAYGNHLILRTAADEEVVLILAHLRVGSLLVAEGERVTVGQPLAEVGNSGNTTEPHLHLHAEARTADTVTPVPLRLAARPARELRRGRRLDR